MHALWLFQLKATRGTANNLLRRSPRAWGGRTFDRHFVELNPWVLKFL